LTDNNIKYTLKDISNELTALKSRLRSNNVLDPQGINTLDTTIENIKAQMCGRKKLKTAPWKFEIEPSRPLLFNICEVKGYKLQVDIFCSISYPDKYFDNWNETLTIRIWSVDEKLFYRESLDFEKLKRIGRRVMARFHFDRANPGQAGPHFHLQIGGKPHLDEFCWYPKELEVPRFIHHPMNLMLACEFVIANFFPEKYDKISKEVTWQMALKKCQEYYLIPYYKTNMKNWDQKESLLKYLWNNYETLCS